MPARKRSSRDTQSTNNSLDKVQNAASVDVPSPTKRLKREIVSETSTPATENTTLTNSEIGTRKAAHGRTRASKSTTTVKDRPAVLEPSTHSDSSKSQSKVKLDEHEGPVTSHKGKPKASGRSKDTTEKAPSDVSTGEVQKKQHKTKEEKAAEAMPLAARAFSGPLKLGAHVSAAGGVHNALTNAVHIGANAFALFLKSQRKWENPPLKDEVRLAFRDGCKQHSYDATAHCVPHGSYLVNLAAEAKEKADQAYAGFLDDIQRCEKLGIHLYNFHPGNTNGHPRAEAIARIAHQLNRAHKATKTVVLLLENMAAAASANTIGGRFEDLRDAIALVEDKSRVGVCLDTCHAFAAGYDIRTPEALEATLAEFDKIVGKQYLKAVHLNDSKGMFNSNRDLHQNIGQGFLGLRAFHALVNEPLFHGIPLILETPCDFKDVSGKSVEDKGIWAREIKMLESLVGMNPEGEQFKLLEDELQAKGASERQKLQAQFEKKQSSPQKKKGLKKTKDA